MRILELCPFSAGVCGVWSRVKSESSEFIKRGHTVQVFSSDIEKGTGRRVSLSEESIGSLNVKRFPSKNTRLDNLISDNVHHWFSKEVEKQIISFNPDIIISHLMHPHSANLSRLVPKLKKTNPKIKTFLVPHAPFNVKRKFPLNLLTWIWRHTSRLNLNSFDAVIAITHWELPYLRRAGISETRIDYIPNGIASSYLEEPYRRSKIKGDVLFFGRIAPVKNIELIVELAKELPNVSFSIVGSEEPEYGKKIRELAKGLSNLSIHAPIYNIKDKIALLDGHKLFLLPSHREAMPQVLIEAMSRGLVVLSSSTDGAKEIISDRVNGFIFNKEKKSELKELILSNLSGNKSVSSRAVSESKKYLWPSLANKYEALFY